jgi:hypothetical protein
MPTLPSNCAPSPPQVETWKPLSGYYDNYEVSDFGRVRNASGLVLRPCFTVRGYIQVTLRRHGIGKARTVHSLVAEAFLGSCPTGYQVNHKNGIKTDARLSNLEYVTPAENMRHARAMGLYSPYSARHLKLTEDDVRKIRTLFGHMTNRQIAEMYGVRRRHITAIKAGSVWGAVK